MKNIKLKLLLFLAVSLISNITFAITKEQEKSFIDQYKQAYESKDSVKLESFLYTKDADPDALEFYKMMLSGDVGSKISSIEIQSLSAMEIKEASKPQEGPSGQMAKLPIAPSKKLVLKIETKDENGSSTSTSQSFLAEFEGKLLIPVPVKVK